MRSPNTSFNGGIPLASSVNQSDSSSGMMTSSEVLPPSTPVSPYQGQSCVFTCWICRFQVDDPVTCANGHLFCRHCVNRWIEPRSYTSYLSNGSNSAIGLDQNGTRGHDEISQSNGTVHNGGSVPRKSFCPTCRIPLSVESLRPILGAQEEHSNSTYRGKSADENSCVKMVLSRKELRNQRFSSLRDLYESEITLLLSEIEDLEDRLSSRRGAKYESAGVQTDGPMASMKQLLSTTDKFETTLRLSLELKAENDSLKKRNEDLEMERSSLQRALGRVDHDDRSNGTTPSTPSKFGGKYVVSTLEKTIEGLQKENEQLKKALDRQDQFIKDLEARKHSSSTSNTELELNSWGNLKTISENNTSGSSSARKLGSRVKSFGEIALPSQSPCKNLAMKSSTKSESKKPYQSKTEPKSKMEGSCTPKMAAKEIENEISNCENSSVRPTRRTLFSNETKRFIEKEPSSSEAQLLSETTALTFNGHKIANVQSKLSDKIGLESDLTDKTGKSPKTRNPSPSKIPRPRSQSPKVAQELGINSTAVRRSPRKNPLLEVISESSPGHRNNSSHREKSDVQVAEDRDSRHIDVCPKDDLEKSFENNGSRDGSSSCRKIVDHDSLKSNHSSKLLNEIKSLNDTLELSVGSDLFGEANDDLLNCENAVTNNLQDSVHTHIGQKPSVPSSFNTPKICPPHVEDDADQSDAFLNEIFSSTEKRVGDRISTKLNSTSSSIKTTDGNEEKLESNSIQLGRLSSLDEFKSLSSAIVSQSAEMSEVSRNKRLESDFSNDNQIALSPGKRHSAEFYPVSRTKASESDASIKTNSELQIVTPSFVNSARTSTNLSIDTQSVLANLNNYQISLSEITTRYQSALSSKINDITQSETTKYSIGDNKVSKNLSSKNLLSGCGRLASDDGLEASTSSNVGTSSNCVTRPDFLKDVDETLDEIRRLKEQSIHSLATASTSPTVQNADCLVTSNMKTPRKGNQELRLGILSLEGTKSPVSSAINTTPRSTIKRTFEEMTLK